VHHLVACRDFYQSRKSLDISWNVSSQYDLRQQKVNIYMARGTVFVQEVFEAVERGSKTKLLATSPVLGPSVRSWQLPCAIYFLPHALKACSVLNHPSESQQGNGL
jgi:hypothetical protein